MALGALTILGAVGTGVAVLLFINLVVKEGPLFAGMVTYVVPLFALMWGAADGETITSRQLLAMAGVLSMVALVQLGSRSGLMTSTSRDSAEPHFCPSENPTDAPVDDQPHAATSD
jgi:drug/metabolite transporter (DMT)-like permease